MKCNVCDDKEAKGNTGLCDSCRLKQWRIDNPKKIKGILIPFDVDRSEIDFHKFEKEVQDKLGFSTEIVEMDYDTYNAICVEDVQ